MHEFNNLDGGLGPLRNFEAFMEVLLAIAAAGFTLVIWLGSSDGSVALQESIRAGRFEQSVPGEHQHVTLPRVTVSGGERRS